MKYNVIKAAPDYLPLSTQDFIRHFTNVFTREKFNHWQQFDDYTMIMGCSCRSLFEMCIEYFSKEELVIVTTPLHHTSFRTVIEKYVRPENIHIIELNEDYNGLSKLPEIEKCDIVVITHLFGQDMDLAQLSAFKEKHKCIILEDRVQGGSLDLKFSHKVVDISLYSMAMDKRPIALGGGFLYIYNKYKTVISDFKENIQKLPEEKPRTRFKDLLKKIPTYLFYNKRVALLILIRILNMLSIFNKKITLLNFGKYYRKTNPGFSRGYFMYKPSLGLLKSMYENFHKHKEIEELYDKKYDFFIKCLSPKIVSQFFPWYKGNPSLTPYNTILLDGDRVDQFLLFLDEDNIAGIANPTYKVFDISYESESRYKKFNNGIVYLPSLVNMSKKEIVLLSNKIKEFYIKCK